MSIVFDPKSFAEKIAPERKIKKLLKKNLTLKKTALSFASGVQEAEDISVKLNKSKITDVALKTVRAYQEREAKETAESDFDKAAGEELAADLVKNPLQLIQRVQGEIIFQVHEKIKKQHAGKRAIWLPSDADEPRPEHQLNYGKEYEIGVGIDGVEPGDEYGCKCGVEILTDETELTLD